jgi:hypothetical protein
MAYNKAAPVKPFEERAPGLLVLVRSVSLSGLPIGGIVISIYPLCCEALSRIVRLLFHQGLGTR